MIGGFTYKYKFAKKEIKKYQEQEDRINSVIRECNIELFNLHAREDQKEVYYTIHSLGSSQVCAIKKVVERYQKESINPLMAIHLIHHLVESKTNQNIVDASVYVDVEKDLYDMILSLDTSKLRVLHSMLIRIQVKRNCLIN